MIKLHVIFNALNSKGLRRHWQPFYALLNCDIQCPEFKGIKTLSSVLLGELSGDIQCPEFKGIRTGSRIANPLPQVVIFNALNSKGLGPGAKRGRSDLPVIFNALNSKGLGRSLEQVILQ